MNKARLTIIVIFAVIILLSVVQTVISNSLSTSGVSLSKIDSEISSFQTENIVLSEKLFTETSLTTIDAKATQMGFIEGASPYVVTSTLPLAIRQ